MCRRLRQESASAVRRSVVGGDWTRRREGEKPWRPIREPLQPRLPTKAKPSLPRPFDATFYDGHLQEIEPTIGGVKYQQHLH